MARKQFVLATLNQHKVEEIRDILKGERWELHSLRDFPETEETVENGKTLLANAMKKASASFQWTGIPSLADDTGLEVDRLKGAPGVLSNRFAGENASYRENNEKLIRLLEGIPREERTARFRCVVALVDGVGKWWVEGVCEGIILSEYRGEKGFGYDPVFYVPEKGKTFAEMQAGEKNTISHRGRAFREMAQLIKRHSGA